MNQEIHYNTVETKNKLNELIEQVTRQKNSILIEKRGKPVAVLLDYQSYQDHYQKIPRQNKTNLIKELHTLHRKLKKQHPKGTGESVSLLQAARAERSGGL